MRFQDLHLALVAHHVPAQLQLVLLRELAHSRARFFVDCSASAPVQVLRGGKQGGVETPELWNLFLSACLRPLLAAWRDRGWGTGPFGDLGPSVALFGWPTI